MVELLVVDFFFCLYGDHRDRHLLTHSFPTRRSYDLVHSWATCSWRPGWSLMVRRCSTYSPMPSSKHYCFSGRARSSTPCIMSRTCVIMGRCVRKFHSPSGQ